MRISGNGPDSQQITKATLLERHKSGERHGKHLSPLSCQALRSDPDLQHLDGRARWIPFKSGTQCWLIKSVQSSMDEPNLKCRIEKWLTAQGGERIDQLEAMAVRLDETGKEIRPSEAARHSDPTWDLAG